MASSLSALTSGFFPSNNHDRLYTADQLANLFSALITDGAVQGSSGDPEHVPFRVAFNGSDNTAVTIGKGLAWLKNTWTSNTATASLSMTDTVAIDVTTGTRRSGGSSANNSNPRWDAIVIEVNKSTTVRANTFAVVEGVPGSNPEHPSVDSCNKPDEGRFYYAIAYVYRPSGSGTVIGGQTSDKLIPAIAQNGGLPYITSLVSESTSIDDLLNRWNDEIESSLSELRQAISEAGEAQLLDLSVTTSKLADLAVTGDKIANGTIPKMKLGFSVAELTGDGKVAADNASSLVTNIVGNVSLYEAYSGKTICVNSSTPTTVTIPSDVNWSAGTEIEIIRFGIGTVSLAVSGSTRLFCSANGEQTTMQIAHQYGTVVIKMLSANQWLVAGDVE